MSKNVNDVIEKLPRARKAAVKARAKGLENDVTTDKEHSMFRKSGNYKVTTKDVKWPGDHPAQEHEAFRAAVAHYLETGKDEHNLLSDTEKANLDKYRPKPSLWENIFMR